MHSSGAGTHARRRRFGAVSDYTQSALLRAARQWGAPAACPRCDKPLSPPNAPNGRKHYENSKYVNRYSEGRDFPPCCHMILSCECPYRNEFVRGWRHRDVFRRWNTRSSTGFLRRRMRDRSCRSAFWRRGSGEQIVRARTHFAVWDGASPRVPRSSPRQPLTSIFTFICSLRTRICAS